MDIKLIISADESALRFADLLGGLVHKEAVRGSVKYADQEEIITSKGVTVGSDLGVDEDMSADIKTAPIDQPQIINEPQVTYTAEELREVAMKIPKTAECQQEIVRILQSSCAEGGKATVSNILPENSETAMNRLKTLAGIK